MTEGLSRELILQQAREAARLFEEAKHKPALAAAAEERAKLLCRGLAGSIKAELSREEGLCPEEGGVADVVQETSGADAADDKAADPVSAPVEIVVKAPARGPPGVPALKKGFLTGGKLLGPEQQVVTTTHRGQPGAGAAPQSAAKAVGSAVGLPPSASPESGEGAGATTASRESGAQIPRSPATRASLDYSRFSAAAAGADDEDDDGHEPGRLRWDEAYRIAHRCAGVIEEIRSSPLPPQRKNELISQTEGVLDFAASATEAEVREIAKEKASKSEAAARGKPIVVQSGPLGPPCQTAEGTQLRGESHASHAPAVPPDRPTEDVAALAASPAFKDVQEKTLPSLLDSLD